MKIKKISIVSGLVAVILVYVGLMTYRAHTAQTAKVQQSNQSQHSQKQNVKLSNDPYLTVQGDKISTQVQADLQLLTNHPDESEIILSLHEMTHQKVIASEKWGAVEMTQNHIEEIYKIIKESNFPEKSKLLTIVSRWKKGDFSHIVQDHNYFWTMEDGTLGKATGRMSKTQEQQFIRNNFK